MWSWSHFEIKLNKNNYIIDKVLLYGYSEKTFKVIQTYSLWCRSLMKTIPTRQISIQRWRELVYGGWVNRLMKTKLMKRSWLPRNDNRCQATERTVNNPFATSVHEKSFEPGRSNMGRWRQMGLTHSAQAIQIGHPCIQPSSPSLWKSLSAQALRLMQSKAQDS